MKINKNIEKYKNYVRVALKDAYGFNEEEIKDAMNYAASFLRGKKRMA